jgi:hypothetical protein
MPTSPLVARHLDLEQGVVIQVSTLVSEGELIRFDSRLTGGSPELMVAPLTYFAMTHSGLWPLETRFTRGMIELENERRRRRKEGESQ